MWLFSCTLIVDRGLLLPLPGPMRRLFQIGIVALVAGLTGCVTPSIPIPPPDPSAIAFAVTRDDSGVVNSASLSYPATDNYKGGIAYVYNRTQGHGIIENVHPDGSVGPTTPIPAALGNSIVFSIENDDQTVATCVLLSETPSTGYCP